MTGTCPHCGAGPLSRSTDGVCCVCLTQSPAPAPLGHSRVTAGRHRAGAVSSFLLGLAMLVALAVGFCGEVR